MRAVVAAVFITIVALGNAAGAEDPLVAIPFVGCPGDGQQGPVEPQRSGAPPTLPASAASRLAYYGFLDVRVLAPRGWHCFGLIGSNGETLLVTSESHKADDFLRAPPAALTGSAVQLSLTFGGTSGRFHVAKIAARMFPIAQGFVQKVIEDQKHIFGDDFDGGKEFPSGPYPNDVLTTRSDTEVEFTTPANSDGLGTSSWLAKNSAPISGLAILAIGEMNLVQADVRLPAEMRDLTPTILGMVRRDFGKPKSE